MKRYFACILALILLIPCLAVPVSATTQGVIDAIEDQTDNLGSQFVTWFYELGQQIEVASQDIVTAIHDKVDYLEAVLNELLSGVKADISSIKGRVYQIYTTMESYFQPWSNYFQSISYNIQQLLNGDTTNSDQFNEDLIPVETETDEILDAIETAPTIDVEGVSGLIDSMGFDFVSEGDDTGALSYLFRILLSPEGLFFQIIMMSLVMAIIGYILYGKA